MEVARRAPSASPEFLSKLKEVCAGMRGANPLPYGWEDMAALLSMLPGGVPVSFTIREGRGYVGRVVARCGATRAETDSIVREVGRRIEQQLGVPAKFIMRRDAKAGSAILLANQSIDVAMLFPEAMGHGPGQQRRPRRSVWQVVTQALRKTRPAIDEERNAFASWMERMTSASGGVSWDEYCGRTGYYARFGQPGARQSVARNIKPAVGPAAPGPRPEQVAAVRRRPEGPDPRLSIGPVPVPI